MDVLQSFHPSVGAWFSDTLGRPTPPQVEGWPLIQSGRHTLIAAPTGSGKTLSAFLSAIDALARQGTSLPDHTTVVYVSPLRALSNDIQKNLQGPLAELRARDASLPEIRVMVRTGDTPASARAAMGRRPPHILVTTPESLYLMVTSDSGRQMLGNVRTVIVDEIHALARDKRGAHLALTLERLESLAGPFQRIGLSATQKPLEDMARFLVGNGRECALVDSGTYRALDVAVEVPPSPLATVCSHEQWEEVYERVAALIAEHRTTLVFVNTRKMAERISAQLTTRLGEDAVTSHHGSLARERRMEAEERLKTGRLRALVATASLELGIDIGDVDLVIQVGSTRSIATFLQRVGRSGHGVGRVPKGRLFPLTIDELVEAAALLHSVRQSLLDRTPQPVAPLDILAQQVVASCVAEPWSEPALFDMCRRAWPFRDLGREDFDRVVAVHTDGRRALLHRDGVNGRLMATRRARIPALTSGGAIPDLADYQVRTEPDGTLVGTLNEDFAIESNAGDVFQLGNTSWRVLRVEAGVVRVADAHGQPPSIPFWLGEAPGRTRELSAEAASLREACADAVDPAAWLRQVCGDGFPDGAVRDLVDYVREGRATLGTVPTQTRVVLERFFDESGGMQLVLHAPFGSRINRAWGLALRKKFCVGFGFELQAAANEDAIVLSLGPQHSFELDGVFDYLHPNSAREVLVQALLQAPLFQTRWRWNAQRALLLDRMRNGRRVPAPLLRMRADDLLTSAFPQVLACPETLPPGPVEVPDHPLVRQTVDDCLTEAMDVEGFLEVLAALRSGVIERVAIDTATPSTFARGILSSQPYTFLDDAPLEERRTQAVARRRVLDPKQADDVGALDPDAIARVRDEAWPQPENAEEVHEALLWMGYVTPSEAEPWREWLEALAADGRVELAAEGWRAVDGPRDPATVLAGRFEALGPLPADHPALAGAESLLLELEGQGRLMRTRLEGRAAWCDRRLLARIHRATLDRLRREIEPVTASQFLHFLACWQRAEPAFRAEGPRGVVEVLSQLAGFEAPAAAWEGQILPARVRNYQRDWLDQATGSGELVWGRLWGSGTGPLRRTPLTFVRRDDLDAWAGLASTTTLAEPTGTAGELLSALRRRGPSFLQELQKATGHLPSALEADLGELVGLGRATCDSFSGLRGLVAPGWARSAGGLRTGRWSLLSREDATAPHPEFAARQLLRRTGVVFRRTVQREKLPVPWRDVARACRALELRGEIRGGRFVAGFDGEQYALPEAVELLRDLRRKGGRALGAPPPSVSASDPLNFAGILTPEDRVPSGRRQLVRVG